MDQADIEMVAAKLSRTKIGPEARAAAATIMENLSFDECAHALSAAISEGVEICLACGGSERSHKGGCYLA